MGNCLGLETSAQRDANEHVEVVTPLAPVGRAPRGAGAAKNGRTSKNSGDSFVDVLFFPDTGMPCKNFRSDKGCKRKNCKSIHDEGSSLLTLLGMLNNTKRTMDICVFTITCDEIADAVLAAHARKVKVRVITDDDQAKGRGSDIQKFIDAGILVRDDQKRTYMHNKFCILDKDFLLNGSFNWSRQAVTGNNENLVINRGGPIVDRFQDQFEKLWKQFEVFGSHDCQRRTMMLLRNHMRRASAASSLLPSMRWNVRAMSAAATLPPPPAAAASVATELTERIDTLERIQAMPTRERFRVALVGRTNVGKSTLYNRLTKTRSAIVHNVPGTTRDRRYAVAHLAGMEFDVIDTGGLEDAPSGTLEEGMLEQTRKAVHEADLVFFLIDGRQGVTPIDSHFARWLRRENAVAPIHVVANKVEGYPDRWEDALNECYQLGMGDALPLSAEHGEGITNLLDVLIPAYEQHEKEQDAILAAVQAVERPTETSLTAASVDGATPESKDEADDDDDTRTIRLAIVGRPNVGKSTLLNRIVRKERVLTGPEPGVTRDSVEVPWSFRGQPIKLVDTAGIRKYSKRDHANAIENLSVRDAFRAIDSAMVVIVVVDMSEDKLIHMDLTIAHRVIEEGRGLIIAANKADLTGDAEFEMQRIRDELGGSLAQVKGVPVVPISALTGKGIRKLLPEVMKAYEKWDLRVTTGRLNRWMKAMARHHPPPTVRGKALNVKYVTQVKSRPPTFALFVNKPSDVPESYQRFLLTQLREEFDMVGVPVRLLLRGNSDANPFEKRKKFQQRTSSVAHGKARKPQNPPSTKPKSLKNNQTKK